MVLPTKAHLAKWKMDGVNDKCPFCKKPENLKHVFIECPRTKPLWEYVSDLIGKITNKAAPPVTLIEAVFNTIMKTQDPIQTKLTRYLKTTALTVIWNTRNAKLKETKIPELKQELKRRIKERIKADITNNNDHNVNNIWAYQNILIKVTGDKIIFTL